MAKIILLQKKDKYRPGKPPGPKGTIGGAAAVKKTIITQAVSRAA